MVRIIGLTGKMFSGKSTVSAIIQNVWPGMNVVNVKMAQPMYDIQEYIYNKVGLPIPYPKDRKLLQWIGTEWGRAIDKDLWLKAWGKEVNEILSESPINAVVCDDVRYDNEAEYLKSLGGKIIDVICYPKIKKARGASDTGEEHPSEQGIDPRLIDDTIMNNDTLIHLEMVVRGTLEHVCRKG